MRIGFTNEAADALTDAARENNTMDLLIGFQEHNVKTLCQSLCEPGSTISGLARAGGGAVPQIPNLREAFSAMAKRKLKIACYRVGRFARVEWTLMAADITTAAIASYDVYR
jgi:hypothetical protein